MTVDAAGVANETPLGHVADVPGETDVFAEWGGRERGLHEP